MNKKQSATNYKKFLKYEERQRLALETKEKRMKQSRVKNNLSKFDSLSPDHLKNARYKHLDKGTRKNISTLNIKPPFDKFNVIISRSSKYSMFVIHAILRQIIATGEVTPGEIRTTTLIDGYNNVNGMFQSRSWKDDFFDPKAKILIIDGASLSLSKLHHRDEEKFWREFIEFTRNEDKLVFITYSADEEAEIGQRVIIPSLITVGTINSLLIRKSLFAHILTKEEENSIDEQRNANKTL